MRSWRIRWLTRATARLGLVGMHIDRCPRPDAFAAPAPDLEREHTLREELADLEAQLTRHTEAIVIGGEMAPLVARMKALDRRRVHVWRARGPGARGAHHPGGRARARGRDPVATWQLARVAAPSPATSAADAHQARNGTHAIQAARRGRGAMVRLRRRVHAGERGRRRPTLKVMVAPTGLAPARRIEVRGFIGARRVA